MRVCAECLKTEKEVKFDHKRSYCISCRKRKFRWGKMAENREAKLDELAGKEDTAWYKNKILKEMWDMYGYPKSW
jgi:hypothetical protein